MRRSAIPRGPARLRGAALLVMLAVLALGVSWLAVSRLATSANRTAAIRAHNSRVLNHAKQALIGYVAQLAARAGENNPGRLPCPEAAGFYGDPTQEGIASGSCTLPKVGRFPWRTLGLDRLLDAAGEPLWYVVSPGWAYTSSNLVINSNTEGQLTVDGVSRDSVALIIAPGPAFAVPAAVGCAAWSQVRPTSGTLDVRNYLECENATSPPDAAFVTSGPSGSFNDQVVRVTKADLMPAIEAAIAHRIEREIAPKLRQVYMTANGWTLSPGVALPATTGLFPFAAPFTDPDSAPDPDSGGYPDRSVFKGTAGSFVGLAPLARHVPGTIAWINPAATFTLTLLRGPGAVSAADCSASSPSVFDCTIVYELAPVFALQVDASNIGTGFRQAPGVRANLTIVPILGSASGTVSNWLLSDGSARVRIELTPAFAARGSFRVQLTINASDAPIEDIATGNSWYFRNGWHKLTLYALSPGFAPGSGGTCGGAGPACLTFSDSIYPVSGKHAAFILAGRALNGQTRPSGVLSDFVEGENLSLLDQTLRRGAASARINDRVVALAP